MVTTVMLVDDHPLVREALVHLLGPEPDVTVVAVAADAATALELLGRCRPDVVVMDVVLPGVDGIAATRELLVRRPTTRVVMLSAGFSLALVREAVAAGACGYLLKGDHASELAPSIRIAAQGLHPVSPEVASLGPWPWAAASTEGARGPHALGAWSAEPPA